MATMPWAAGAAAADGAAGVPGAVEDLPAAQLREEAEEAENAAG